MLKYLRYNKRFFAEDAPPSELTKEFLTELTKTFQESP